MGPQDVVRYSIDVFSCFRCSHDQGHRRLMGYVGLLGLVGLVILVGLVGLMSLLSLASLAISG